MKSNLKLIKKDTKSLSNAHNYYSSFIKFIHWSTALLIIINYVMGLTIESRTLFLVHEQIGLTLLLLALMRIIWRWQTIPYKKLSFKSGYNSHLLTCWYRFLHSFTTISLRLHAVIFSRYILLYALMILIPISGILIVNAKANYQLTFWWIFTLPNLIAKQIKDVSHLLVVWHLWLSHFLMMLIFIHSLIALIYHYFIKDNLLTRMLPRKKH